MIGNVWCLIGAANWAIIKKNSKVLTICRTRETNIKLAMGEDWDAEVEAYVVEGLTLRFIDGHPECQTNGKLQSPEDERKVATCVCVQCDTWDESCVSCARSSENFAFNNSPSQSDDQK